MSSQLKAGTTPAGIAGTTMPTARGCLWDSYNVVISPISKSYAPGGISPATNARPSQADRGSIHIGASHAGHRHAGARPRVLHGGHRLRLRLRTVVRGVP